MKGVPRPYVWANEMGFHPDSTVRIGDAAESIALASDKPSVVTTLMENGPDVVLHMADALFMIWEFMGKPSSARGEISYKDVNRRHACFDSIRFAEQQGWIAKTIEGVHLNPDSPITRKKWAMLLDHVFLIHSIALKWRHNDAHGRNDVHRDGMLFRLRQSMGNE